MASPDREPRRATYYDRGFQVPREVLVRAAKVVAGCATLHIVAEGVLRAVVPAKTRARLSPGDRLFLPEK